LNQKLLKKLSSFSRFLTIVGISIFLFLVVLNFLADNFYTKRIIQTIVNEKLSDLTDLRVSYNALEFKALPFRIDLFGLELTRDDDLKIQATRLKIGLNLINLLLGKANVVELVLYGLKLDLAHLEKGGTAEGTDLGFPTSFESFGIASIGLRNSEILYNTKDIDLLIRDFNCEVAFRSEERIQIKIDAHRSFFRFEDFSIFQAADLHIEGSMLNTAQARLSILVVDGALDLSASSDLTLILSSDRIIKDFKVVGKYSGKGDLSVLGRMLDIDESLGGVLYNGDFSLPTNKKTEPFDFEVSAKVEVTDGYIGGFRVFDSAGNIKVTKERLSFEEVQLLRNAANLANATGHIELKKGGGFDFILQPQKMDLDSTFKALKVEMDIFESIISQGELAITGVMKPFQMKVSGQTQFKDFRLQKLKLSPERSLQCDAKLELDIDTTGMKVDKSGLDCTGSYSKAPIFCALSGDIYFDEKKGLNLSNTCTNGDIAVLEDVLNLPLKGQASFLQTITGPYSQIWLRHKIQAEQLIYGTLDLGKVQVDLDLDPKMDLIWKQFVAYLPESIGIVKSIKGRSSLDFDVDIDLEASQVPSRFLRQFNDTFLKESPFVFKIKNAKGNIKGPLIFPLYQASKVVLEVEDVEYFDRPLAHSIHVELDSMADNFRLKRGVYRYRDLLVDFDIEVKHDSYNSDLSQLKSNLYGLAGSDRVVINFESRSSKDDKTSQIFQDSIQQLPVVGELFANIGLESRLKAIGQLAGPYQDLRLRADLELYQPRWFRREIAPLVVAVNQDSKLLVVDVRQKDGGLVTKLDIRKNELRARGSLTRLNLLPVFHQLVPSDPRHYSYLSSHFDLSLDMNHPLENISGQVDIVDFEMGLVDSSKTHVIVLDKGRSVRFDRSKISLVEGDELKLIGDGYSLTLTPRGGQALQRLKLDLRGNFDIAAAAAMSEQVEFGSGFVDFEGAIEGSVDRLEPVISFRSRGETSLGLTRPGLTNIHMNGRYEKGEMILESFRADKGNGEIAMRGVVGMDNIKATAVEIALTKAFFVVRTDVLKNIDTELSGQLTLSGEKWPYRLSGDVQIDKAVSTRNVDFRDQIVSALQQRGQAPVGAGEVLDARTHLILDVNLTARQSMEIYNRNLQTVMSADLSITGTDFQPQVSGQVQIDQGRFSYKYRRDFTITQGLVTFDNPTQLDPKVDIVGVSEVGNYRVFITLTGRSSDVRVDLSADPPSRDDGTPLSKVDILVLMSQGSLPDRTRSEIATQDAAKAEALNIIVGQFEEPVEKIFDMTNQTVLRQVYFDSYSGSDGQPNARVNLPLNLHSDWDVIFRVDSENLRMSLGYDINQSISVAGNIDRKTNTTTTESAEESNDTGVDLRFRFMFP
jgi:hypothetical protein